jgi:peptidylprolyl isomerase
MVQAANGDTVRVHYTGRLDDGTVFDSSQEREPMQFTIGQRQLIPGFEQGVIGMEAGESKTVKIPAAEAYGPHEPGKVIEIERSRIPTDLPLEVGSRLQGTPPGGRPVDFTVVSLTESLVTLDGNHPLAGKDLTFDIQLVEIV